LASYSVIQEKGLMKVTKDNCLYICVYVCANVNLAAHLTSRGGSTSFHTDFFYDVSIQFEL